MAENRKWITHFVVTASVLLVASCAGIRVKDEHGQGTGIEFFPAKPYLLVENTKDGPKTSLITLPDVSRPRYLSYKSGLGNVEFGFTLNNGMLAAFNQKTDVRAPELITSFGALATGLAALRAEETGTTVERKAILSVVQQLREKVVGSLGKTTDPVIQEISKRIEGHLMDIEAAAKPIVVEGTDIGAVLLGSDAKIRKSLEALAKTAEPLTKLAAQPGAPAALVQATTALDQILPELKAQVSAPGAITLFEIVPREPKGIDFRRVSLPL